MLYIHGTMHVPSAADCRRQPPLSALLWVDAGTRSFNRLEEVNRKQLADVLSDRGRPWCSVYGAVVGLLAFGLQVCQNLSVYLRPTTVNIQLLHLNFFVCIINRCIVTAAVLTIKHRHQCHSVLSFHRQS